MLRNALEIVPELFELRVRHDGGGSATVLISDLRRARAPSQTQRGEVSRYLRCRRSAVVVISCQQLILLTLSYCCEW